ncbi:uncharacterized protein LOC131239537 isoform X2 [Magnolia sinica]|uniref:uncharacterized protein LOC131239537 isoform X2 n=1 Tax=Magnolia sinica TaxID=86752 RepID=UPI00265A10BC|nr:uncharacterized protein LOC131239537 isoform X2 [Magnolia sinica]
MPSSILSANPRLLTPTIYTKLDGLDRYRRNTKNPLQISKECLRFSISSRNPAVNCRSLPSLSIRCYSTESGKSIDVESLVDRRLGDEVASEGEEGSGSRLNVEVGTPNLPVLLHSSKMSLGDQAFFLLAFIACTAMGRAATSLSKLADTAREELPSTMAAIRLSGMEISDLTLELSDLSQEIADGVSKSAQAVQAAEAGIRQIGAIARRQTICGPHHVDYPAQMADWVAHSSKSFSCTSVQHVDRSVNRPGQCLSNPACKVKPGPVTSQNKQDRAPPLIMHGLIPATHFCATFGLFIKCAPSSMIYDKNALEILNCNTGASVLLNESLTRAGY